MLDYEYYFQLTDAILQNKVQDCLLILNDILAKGFDGSHFITGLSSHFRDLLVSRDAATLPLLEAGASIRQRYQTQAQQCTPRFLYQAMKLSNDCDLNYRASKNKRLLVELTLIQLAQLTEEGADTPAGGQRPTPTLKPITPQQPAAAPGPQPQQPATAPRPQSQQPAAGASRPSQQPSAHPTLPPSSTAAGTAPAAAQNLSAPAAADKKIPVMKADNLGISIRHPQPAAHAKKNAAPAPPPAESAYEDYAVYEKDLVYYWREFAARLPKEETANSARMMNISPTLPAGQTTFEVVVDNEMAQRSLQQLAPQILASLQEKLHNRHLQMTVRVSEANNEHIRAYSQVERFQLMSQKNPHLMKLKEAFGLELG